MDRGARTPLRAQHGKISRDVIAHRDALFGRQNLNCRPGSAYHKISSSGAPPATDADIQTLLSRPTFRARPRLTGVTE